MTEHIPNNLGEFLVGVVAPSELDGAERALAELPTGSLLQREVGEALVNWAGDIPEVAIASAPSETITAGRARLLATLGSVERFRPFFDALAKIFAIDLRVLRELLRKVDDPAAYQSAPIPGVRYFNFSPGEASGFAEAGFVRVAKGTVFPAHQHLGQEVNFVLEGTMHDGGAIAGPGTARWQTAGSRHDYRAGDARDLVIVAGHCGITFSA